MLNTHIFFFLSSLCNFSPWLPRLAPVFLQLPMILVPVPALAVVEAVDEAVEEAMEEAMAEVGEGAHALLNHPRILKLHLLLPRETSFW